MDSIAMQLKEVDTWLYIKPTGQVSKLLIPEKVKNDSKSFYNSQEGIEIRKKHDELLQGFYAGKNYTHKEIHYVLTPLICPCCGRGT